jgi:predicted dehydrogenase
VPLLPDLGALRAAEPDIVFVATPHDVAVDTLREVLPTRAKVFVEKPLGRSGAEARTLTVADDQLWLGLNYRYFRGIEALLQDVAKGTFGEPIHLRLHMGHGGAPGMEQGWKFDPVKAGGGALIDPGIHLLNLAQLAAGEDLSVEGGASWSGFWGTGIEEECHLTMRSPSIPVVSVSVSVVRWRSEFRMELHGTDGYGIVEGRNRSYGPQRYWRGRRWGWQSGVSQRESEEDVLTADGDDVFVRETKAVLFPDAGMPAPCDRREALAAMDLLDASRRVLGLPVPEEKNA